MLTDSERERLREQHYVLNDLGRKAWDAVLRAVLEQLRAPLAGAPQSEAHEKARPDLLTPRDTGTGSTSDGTSRGAAPQDVTTTPNQDGSG
jgi:hypothetical protein